MPEVLRITPPNAPKPIGPYNHICQTGNFITIGGVAGVDPKTGQLAGSTVYLQTKQILKSFEVMLESVHSDLEHVLHINVYLQNIDGFDELNKAYEEVMGTHLPARTVIGVNALPKAGALLTMNLTAITR